MRFRIRHASSRIIIVFGNWRSVAKVIRLIPPFKLFIGRVFRQFILDDGLQIQDESFGRATKLYFSRQNLRGLEG